MLETDLKKSIGLNLFPLHAGHNLLLPLQIHLLAAASKLTTAATAHVVDRNYRLIYEFASHLLNNNNSLHLHIKGSSLLLATLFFYV